MPEPAQITRSLSTIRTELEFLQASNVLSGPQFQSIMAQLPQDGQASGYVDPRYNPNPQQQFNPSQFAQQAQDPGHPAHPSNPKLAACSSHSSRATGLREVVLMGWMIQSQHHEWAKNMASKFGNAAMFGAGATFGGDLVNDVMRKL
ncbi:hypothetical protein B2J93_8922 [Marssonina coronariae]|uniref:Uncharacterized protein n=1 Tax=Diplocarpon coronariae TaxID=2795749 RepID=A0A218YS67_9HELO|nr:hypothetical protein B2J93_8922 [Marssonina coronariae]